MIVNDLPAAAHARATAEPTSPAPPRMKNSESQAIAPACIMSSEPFHGALQPFPQRRLTGETERMQPLHVEYFKFLPVRLRRIPAQLAVIRRQLPNRLGQFANRRCGPGRDVDRLARIVLLDEKGKAAGYVSRIDEIARRAAGPPTHYLAVSHRGRFEKSTHQARND